MQRLEAGEKVLSWGKTCVGHFDGGRRLRRLEEQVQKGQQEELQGLMEQEGQLGQGLGVRAVREAEETWGWE